jgi:phospholipid/cholesterol/gamma-HCH transport system ATP-binding protein
MTEKENKIGEPVIEIRDLCKGFGDRMVLNKFSLNLPKGQSIAVLGKSGSGKSVLIKCIVGLIQPDSGIINVFGKDVASLNDNELDKTRVRIGFLFQSNALYDSMTVRENLEFPLRRHWIEKERKEVDEMVLEALENVGLPNTVDMMPSELSGGMRKRISIARTLILKPDIILYDEPTTGLDPITGKEISKLMVEVQEKYNTSSLIISHDLNCVRIAADRLVMLIEGRNYAQGSYEEMKNLNDEKVKQFFEGYE